ncbi:hypothetical protein [Mesorhizobium sp. WSM2239]|uniref:Uncharacterized protein n=2 Tax=unclassified Mesorhizobium TaxID=325217 RepID=A0AAU8DII8_9HYPH
MLRTIRQPLPGRATLKGSPLRIAALRPLCGALGISSHIRASRLHTTTLEDLPHENARNLLPEDRPPPLYINRQIAKLSHKGQLKISVAFSLPFLAKLELSYQAEFDGKADNDQA